jgi:hypothetical protein
VISTQKADPRGTCAKASMSVGVGDISPMMLPTCDDGSPVSEKDIRRVRGTIGIPRIVWEVKSSITHNILQAHTKRMALGHTENRATILAPCQRR